jgi:hypothetical protein
MRRLFTSTILFLAAVVALGGSEIFAYDNGDWQYWNRESVEGNISKSLKANIDVEFRFGDNMSELYHQYSELGLSYRLCEWFDLGLNYRQVYEKKGETWGQENRPHINATFKWGWSDFKVEDRSRLEYRAREAKDDVFRYRNRLLLKPPLKWTDLNIQPYVADEIFLDFEKGEFNRNRLYLGANGDLDKELKAEAYYLWQTGKSKDHWGDYNIIGTELKAAF